MGPTHQQRLDEKEIQLIADLYPSLRRFASVVCPLEEDPNDLVQDALERTLRRGRLSRLDHPAAYLKRAVFNLAVSSRRHHTTRRGVLERLRPESTPPTYSWDVEELFCVSAKARAVLYLNIIEGRPFAEIGELLGCSDASARAVASRARRRLRRLLSEEVNDATA
jgi:RNA polymerase sigma-70 factor (ECF subfamily)